MRQQAARAKGLKDSVWVLREPDSQQYIAFADENREPHLAPLHLATLAPSDRSWFKRARATGEPPPAWTAIRARAGRRAVNSPASGVSLKLQIAVAVVLSSAFLYALPRLDRWIKQQTAVHALALRVECRAPVEGEQLVVHVEKRGDRWVGTGCTYLTSRGAARRALQAAAQ
jgi:hypothetical protein